MKAIHRKFRSTLMAPFRNARSQGSSADCNWHNISHLIYFCLEWERRGSRGDLLLWSWRKRGHQCVETYLKHLNALQAAVVKLPHLLCCVIFQPRLTMLVLHSSNKKAPFSSIQQSHCWVLYLLSLLYSFWVARSNTLFIVTGLRDINEYDCSIHHLCLDSMHLYLTLAGSFSVL